MEKVATPLTTATVCGPGTNMPRVGSLRKVAPVGLPIPRLSVTLPLNDVTTAFKASSTDTDIWNWVRDVSLLGCAVTTS